jgi:hypothetical protein
MDLRDARRKEQIDRAADDLRLAIAEEALRAAIEERDALARVDRDDRVLGGLDDALEARLGDARRLFGVLAPGALFGFAQCPPCRRRQSCQTFLEDVVGRPQLDRLDCHLLAERAGHEDERHVRTRLPGDAQGGQPVEAGQRVVGEDQVNPAPFERRAKRGFGVDPRQPSDEAFARERRLDELGVARLVLETQDVQRHARVSSSWRFPAAAR